MKKLLIVFLVLVSTHLFSQKILIADETYYTLSTSSIKIISSNDSIVKLIIRDLRPGMTNLEERTKKDRFGEYIEYTFTFKNEYCSTISSFFNKLK